MSQEQEAEGGTGAPASAPRNPPEDPAFWSRVMLGDAAGRPRVPRVCRELGLGRNAVQREPSDGAPHCPRAAGARTPCPPRLPAFLGSGFLHHSAHYSSHFYFDTFGTRCQAGCWALWTPG